MIGDKLAFANAVLRELSENVDKASLNVTYTSKSWVTLEFEDLLFDAWLEEVLDTAVSNLFDFKALAQLEPDNGTLDTRSFFWVLLSDDVCAAVDGGDKG